MDILVPILLIMIVAATSVLLLAFVTIAMEAARRALRFRDVGKVSCDARDAALAAKRFGFLPHSK